MALPSAPLGPLPSLNVPSYVPNTVVPRERKLWEQILAAAAGQAISQGIGNAMSRDYAPEFGQDEAGVLERTFRGPKVSERDALQRRGQAHDQNMLQANVAGQIGLEELRAMPSAQDARRTFEQELQNAERRMAESQNTINQVKLGGIDAGRRSDLEDKRFGNESTLAHIKTQLEESSPSTKATTRLRTAQAEGAEGDAAFTKRLLASMDARDKAAAASPEGQITEAQRQFAAGGGALTPRQQLVQERAKAYEQRDTQNTRDAGNAMAAPVFENAVPRFDDPTQVPQGAAPQPSSPAVDPTALRKQLETMIIMRGAGDVPLGALPDDKQITELLSRLQAAQPVDPFAAQAQLSQQTADPANAGTPHGLLKEDAIRRAWMQSLLQGANSVSR